MKYTLTQAIDLISKKHQGKPLSFIGYEDGSGRTFIYRFIGDMKTHFIRLT